MGVEGLEPPSLAAQDPKSCVSASSTTRPRGSPNIHTVFITRNLKAAGYKPHMDVSCNPNSHPIHYRNAAGNSVKPFIIDLQPLQS